MIRIRFLGLASLPLSYKRHHPFKAPPAGYSIMQKVYPAIAGNYQTTYKPANLRAVSAERSTALIRIAQVKLPKGKPHQNTKMVSFRISLLQLVIQRIDALKSRSDRRPPFELLSYFSPALNHFGTAKPARSADISFRTIRSNIALPVGQRDHFLPT